MSTKQKAQMFPNYCCASCFCPCVILGTIETSIVREAPILKCLSNFPLGKRGVKKCCCVCCAMCPWPFSPWIITHIASLRKQLSIMHREHGYAFNNYTWRSILCWPVNMASIYSFVKEREHDGSLVFDWDLKNYKDHLQPRPELKTVRILLIGPDSCSKMIPGDPTSPEESKQSDHVVTTFPRQRFMRKLLTYCETVSDKAGTRITHPGFESIDIGIKAFRMFDNRVDFLEIWDVPEDQIDSVIVRASLAETAAIFFVFDFNADGMENFRTMQNLYKTHLDLFPEHIKRFCMASNMDHVDEIFEASRQLSGKNSSLKSSDRHKSRKSGGTVVRRSMNQNDDTVEQKRTFFALDLVDEWAHLTDCILVRISFQHNYGLKEVYQELKILFLESPGTTGTLKIVSPRSSHSRSRALAATTHVVASTHDADAEPLLLATDGADASQAVAIIQASDDQPRVLNHHPSLLSVSDDADAGKAASSSSSRQIREEQDDGGDADHRPFLNPPVITSDSQKEETDDAFAM